MQSKVWRTAIVVVGVMMIGAATAQFMNMRDREAKQQAMRAQTEQIQLQIDQLREQLKNAQKPR